MGRSKENLIILLKLILKNSFWALAVIGFAISACEGENLATSDPEIVLLDGEDRCGAGAFSEQLRAGSLNGSALSKLSDRENTRVIRPNSGVTMDFSPDRLNVYLDESGRIVSLSCG